MRVPLEGEPPAGKKLFVAATDPPPRTISAPPEVVDVVQESMLFMQTVPVVCITPMSSPFESDQIDI